MNNPVRLFFQLCLFTATFGCCDSDKSNEGESPDYALKIDSLIEASSPRAFNGVILVTQYGKTKYSKAYGYSNIEGKIPIRLDDNFRIQSNSKQITAVLVLREVGKGNIDLNEPLSTYVSLPNFDQSWADLVTVHQLLNMSSGITSLNEPLLFEPGTDYKYSNAAYGLLGRILEKVTKKSYIQIANELFAEVGMKNTYCYEFDKPQKHPINGYLVSQDQYQPDDFYSRGITADSWNDFIPAGGTISNAIDLNTWDEHLHNGKILSSEMYKLMTTYTIFGQHDAFGAKEIGYGYGVRIDDTTPTKIIGHAGRGIGFANIKFYIPAKSIDVVVLENVYNEDVSIIYHFEKKIREIVMNSSLTR